MSDEEHAAAPARPILDDQTEVHEPSPAHEVAPLHPDDLELAALVHTAGEAEEKIADRDSQEAAHDAFEAEHDTPELGADLGDAFETTAPVSGGGLLKLWPDDE